MFIFKIILLLSISSIVSATSWFQNSEQQGKTAFEQEKYSEAIKLFADPYKRGVALYKDGQYASATEAFSSIDHPALNAQYNLGNSYFQQQEYEKAIQAYEQVLKIQPDHDDVRANLELAKSEQKDSEQSQAEEEKQSAVNSETAMVKESDMMADALLERIKENPQQLLRGQFYIDARNSKQPPPAKPW